MGVTTGRDQKELAECFYPLRFLENLIRRWFNRWGSYSYRNGATAHLYHDLALALRASSSELKSCLRSGRCLAGQRLSLGIL